MNQLQDENEVILTKLSAQDKLLQVHEDAQEKIKALTEENENSQKAIEYYQNDMIPEIK